MATFNIISLMPVAATIVFHLLTFVQARGGHHPGHGQFHAGKHASRLGLRDETASATSATSSSGALPGGNYDSFVQGAQVMTLSLTSSATFSATTAIHNCPASNGETLATPETQYEILCDVDFVGQNIMPFLKAGSLETCVSFCDAHNNDTQTSETCNGVVFVPSRAGAGYADDCYLKSGLDSATTASTPLVAAVAATASSIIPTSASLTFGSHPTATSVIINTASYTAMSTSTPSATSSNISQNFATGTAVVVPSIKDSTLLGASQNVPSTEYVNESSTQPISLASSLLVSGANLELINDYPLAPDTGCRSSASSTSIVPLSEIPVVSRDGGKGGYLNGENIFIFCDTSTYTTPNETQEGSFLGMVSSSIAVDKGMNALNGQPLSLQDSVGEWSDHVWRWLPLCSLARLLTYPIEFDNRPHLRQYHL